MVHTDNGNLPVQWDDPKPGYRWPIGVEKEIDAPAEKVWTAVSMPGNLELCHPYCSKNPVHAWPGEVSHDEVHYFSGLVFERRFCRWIDGVGYDLEIGERGERTSFVSWRIRPVDGKHCLLRIAVYPYLLQNLPAAIRWLPYKLYIMPMLRKYLTSVVGGFAWYATRGESVIPDQFGAHPWFSALKSR